MFYYLTGKDKKTFELNRKTYSRVSERVVGLGLWGLLGFCFLLLQSSFFIIKMH